jgi:hypothetical protein
LESNNIDSMFTISHSSAAPYFNPFKVDFLALTECSLCKFWGLNNVDSGRENFDGVYRFGTARAENMV